MIVTARQLIEDPRATRPHVVLLGAGASRAAVGRSIPLMDDLIGCVEHDTWGAKNGRCPACGQKFSDVPLIYPIPEKDYSKNPFIRRPADQDQGGQYRATHA